MARLDEWSAGVRRWATRLAARFRSNPPPMANTLHPTVIGPDNRWVIGPSETYVIGPAAESLILIGPDPIQVSSPPPITIEPPARSAWDHKGWRETTSGTQQVYDGQFQIRNRNTGHPQRFDGRVVLDRGTPVLYIASPPAEIKQHPKGPCFSLINDPWFLVHWRRPAQNVDDAILYVERILDEAVNGVRG